MELEYTIKHLIGYDHDTTTNDLHKLIRQPSEKLEYLQNKFVRDTVTEIVAAHLYRDGKTSFRFEQELSE